MTLSKQIIHHDQDTLYLFHGVASMWELGRMIARQIDYRNHRRRHSTLAYTEVPIDYIIQEEILPQPVFGLALQRT